MSPGISGTALNTPMAPMFAPPGQEEKQDLSQKRFSDVQGGSMHKWVKLHCAADPDMPCPLKERFLFAQWMAKFARQLAQHQHPLMTSNAIQMLESLPDNYARRFALRLNYTNLHLTRDVSIEAMIMTLGGTRIPTPCTLCAKGEGPFEHCRVVPGMFNGSCNNCHYQNTGDKCSSAISGAYAVATAVPFNRKRVDGPKHNSGDNTAAPMQSEKRPRLSGDHAHEHHENSSKTAPSGRSPQKASRNADRGTRPRKTNIPSTNAPAGDSYPSPQVSTSDDLMDVDDGDDLFGSGDDKEDESEYDYAQDWEADDDGDADNTSGSSDLEAASVANLVKEGNQGNACYFTEYGLVDSSDGTPSKIKRQTKTRKSIEGGNDTMDVDGRFDDMDSNSDTPIGELMAQCGIRPGGKTAKRTLTFLKAVVDKMDRQIQSESKKTRDS